MAEVGTYTITARPGEWRFINAYEPWDMRAWPDRRPRYSVVLADASLLPEEIANEVRVSRWGVYLNGWNPPAVEHFEGWEKLEAELRRMEATNRPKDALFEGAVVDITFSQHIVPPRGPYTTPLLTLPVSLIKIVAYEGKGE